MSANAFFLSSYTKVMCCSVSVFAERGSFSFRPPLCTKGLTSGWGMDCWNTICKQALFRSCGTTMEKVLQTVSYASRNRKGYSPLPWYRSQMPSLLQQICHLQTFTSEQLTTHCEALGIDLSDPRCQ